MFWLTSALAADALSLMAAANIAPARVQVETGATYSYGLQPMPSEWKNQGTGYLRAHLPVSQRVAVDAAVGGHVGNQVLNYAGFDVVVRGKLALIDHEYFRFGLVAGFGTSFEAGVSLWFKTDRVEFSVTHQVAAEIVVPKGTFGGTTSWAAEAGRPIRFTIDGWRCLPEASLLVDVTEDHHLRLGHRGLSPMVGYRWSPGRFHVEITAGSLILQSHAAVEAGWRI